jgi:nitrite reductase/ring-hydroxylating ferredoxin subunit
LVDIPREGLQFDYKEGPFVERGILLCAADGSARAFKNECRHLPMPLDDRAPSRIWDDTGTHLMCCSHGARYRPDDGLCVSGPCEGSHLRSLPIVVEGDEVFLDTSKLGGFFEV